MKSLIREEVFFRILSISISFDLKFSHIQSTRLPDVDQLIDDLCQRLNQAIEICERTNLSTRNILLGIHR